MNEFRKRADGAVVSEADFRNAFPDSAFPAVLDAVTLDACGYDAVMVSTSPMPAFNETAQRDGVVHLNGHWVQAWKIIPLTADATAASLTYTKANMWDRIQAERDRREAGGVKVGDHWFHTDVGSLVKYLSLRAAGADLPEGINWKTMDGTKVPMTPELVNEIYMTAMATNAAIFEAGEAHKHAMETSPNPGQYQFGNNWPRIYGDPEPATVIPPIPVTA